MLHPHIIVQESRIAGQGLFAKTFIKQGEIIWERDPWEKHYSLREINTWSQEQRNRFFSCSYQVGEDLFYGMDGSPPDPADYMNHSCDPNVGFLNDKTMIALRDILPGEEVTYDYVMSETRADFYIECKCHSPMCRRIISPRNLIDNPALLRKYRKYLMSHVVAFLRRQGLEL